MGFRHRGDGVQEVEGVEDLDGVGDLGLELLATIDGDCQDGGRGCFWLELEWAEERGG